MNMYPLVRSSTKHFSKDFGNACYYLFKTRRFYETNPGTPPASI